MAAKVVGESAQLVAMQSLRPIWHWELSGFILDEIPDPTDDPAVTQDPRDINDPRLLDQFCDEYEDNWSADSRLKIESYLNRVGSELRDRLLGMLLEIDVELRRKANQTILHEDYADLGESALHFVNQLIDVNPDITSLPEGSSFEMTRTSSLPPSSLESQKQIGPYRLLQEIGEGGMGTVWMAEQKEPVRRRVALKVIKTGMDSKQVIARFEAERQALAMMNHHNIAKVLDAGMTEGGRPYFAMELVDGIAITEYCDRNRLSPKERLELFVPVCSAIQHAHQKGIIHRDIKPSNVLVTLHDGVPVPKVIDFGLAKALQPQHQLTDKTMFTEFGQVVGTWLYMSPEQAERNGLDVDTRTDIYSLGVVLYQLLTGSTPLERESIRDAAWGQIVNMICEREPPKPSARLSASGDAITGISNQRKVEPRKLQHILRGELDWVVMKSLEKDRTRRYETVGALAEDVKRFLKDQPVQARPPSIAYRLSKSFHRHRVPILATAVSIAMIMVAVFGTMRVAQRDRNELITSQLLDRLFAANTSQIGQVLDELRPVRPLATPRLYRVFEESPDESPKKLHAALAISAFDDGVVDFLSYKMLEVEARHLKPVCNLLHRHSEQVSRLHLEILKDQSIDRASRFRAVCALANFLPQDSMAQLSGESSFCADYLVGVSASEFTFWLENLFPLRESLKKHLLKISRDPESLESARALASDALVNFFSEDSKFLFDLLAESEPRQFVNIQRILSVRHTADAIKCALEELENGSDSENKKDNGRRSAQRKCNSALLLLNLGVEQPVWKLLQQSPNQTTRNLIIHHYARMGGDPTVALERFKLEPDLGVKRALLLILGTFDPASLKDDARRTFSQSLIAHYVEHPDPGIHSAVEWLLKKWKVANDDELREMVAAAWQTNEDASDESGQIAELTSEIWDRAEKLEDQLNADIAKWNQQSAAVQSGLDDGLIFKFKPEVASGRKIPDSHSEDVVWRLEEAEVVDLANGVLSKAARIGSGWNSSFIKAATPIPELDLDRSFSIGGWFFSQAERGATLLSKTNSANDKGLVVEIWPSKFVVELNHKWPHDSVRLDVECTGNVGRWFHVMVTLSPGKTNKKLNLFVDGELAGNQELPENFGEVNSNEPVCIGAKVNGVYFAGLVDEIRGYSRDLSEIEVKALYSRGLESIVALEPIQRGTARTRLITKELSQRHPEFRDLLERRNKLVESRFQQRSPALGMTGEPANDEQKEDGVGWFVNSLGQTFSVLNAKSFLGADLGFLEEEFGLATNKWHKLRTTSLNRLIAVGNKEVTVREYREFIREHPNFRPLYSAQEFSPEANCPQTGISWFSAAAFCRWLSEREGIPENEMCFPPISEIKPGMRMRDGYLKKTGYRLPTLREWEYATRAQTETLLFFGEAESLLQKYAWVIENSQQRTWPTGTLLPNDFGLFDVYGNASEWIQESNLHLNLDNDLEDLEPVVAQIRPIIGGGCFSNRVYVNSSWFTNYPPSAIAVVNCQGFRIARTITRRNMGQPEAGRVAEKVFQPITDPAILDAFENAAGAVTNAFAFCSAMGLDRFRETVEALRNHGFRPTRVRPYNVGDKVFVAAAWTRDEIDWVIRESNMDINWQTFVAEQDKKGYVPTDLAIYSVSSNSTDSKLMSVWEIKTDPNDVRIAERTEPVWAEVRKKFNAPTFIGTQVRYLAADASIQHAMIVRKSQGRGGFHWFDRSLTEAKTIQYPGHPHWEIDLGLRPNEDPDSTGDISVNLTWRYLNDIESKILVGVSVQEHAKLSRILMELGYYPMAISAVAMPDESVKVGSVWHRSLRAQ